MKTTLFAIAVALCLLGGSGCDLFDPVEPTPAFIVIPSFNFETDYPTEFTDSEKFTEVWVYANDQVIGAYDLPAEIPILETGETELEFIPGIKNNGIASTRRQYPFIENDRRWITLEPGKLDTIIPEFRYKDNVTIINADDFEVGTVFTVNEGSQGSINRVTNNDLVFEGDGSGFGFLSEGENTLKMITNEQQYDLPKNRLSWLEMNYKCNNSMAVGIQAVSQSTVESQYIIILNPTTNAANQAEWNKIYIELSPTVATYQNAAHFELVIDAVRDQDNTGEIEVFLDNLKLVHF